MKTFEYKAKKGPDQVTTGRMAAMSTQEVVEKLNRSGLTATSVKEVAEPGREGRPPRTAAQHRVPLKDLIIFTRQLGTLIASGLPILRVLKILAEQTANKHFSSIIDDIAGDVMNGRPLSAGLQKYPRVFSLFYVAMVKAGEDAGSLDQCLARVSLYYTKQAEFIAKVRAALTYPLLILVVGFLTVVYIFTNVIPNIIPLLIDLRVDLPLPTRILIGASAFIKRHGFYTALWLCIAGLIVNRACVNKQFRYYLSTLRLRVPFFGDLTFKAEFARFARTMEIALHSGIPIVRALDISLAVVGEEIMKDTLVASRKALESGASLGNTFKQSRHFPPLVYNLIIVGEESGRLEEAFAEIASSFETDTEEKIKTMTILLEPIMVLAVGLVVAFIVAAVLLPIFSLNFMKV